MFYIFHYNLCIFCFVNASFINPLPGKLWYVYFKPIQIHFFGYFELNAKNYIGSFPIYFLYKYDF